MAHDMKPNAEHWVCGGTWKLIEKIGNVSTYRCTRCRLEKIKIRRHPR